MPIDQQNSERVAVVYGPIVLVQKVDSTLPRNLNATLKQFDGHENGLFFLAGKDSAAQFVPFYSVGAGTPYKMYFDLPGVMSNVIGTNHPI